MSALLALSGATLASPPIGVQRYSSWSNIFVVINESVDFAQSDVAVGRLVEFASFPPIAGIQQTVNGRHVVRSLFTQKGVAHGLSITLPTIAFVVPDIARFPTTERPTVRSIPAPAPPPRAPDAPPPAAPPPALPPPLRPSVWLPRLAPPPGPREPPPASPAPPPLSAATPPAADGASGVRRPVVVVSIIAGATGALMVASTVASYCRWRAAGRWTHQVHSSAAASRL